MFLTEDERAQFLVFSHEAMHVIAADLAAGLDADLFVNHAVRAPLFPPIFVNIPTNAGDERSLVEIVAKGWPNLEVLGDFGGRLNRLISSIFEVTQVKVEKIGVVTLGGVDAPAHAANFEIFIRPL